jgi:hypothetical protein
MDGPTEVQRSLERIEERIPQDQPAVARPPARDASRLVERGVPLAQVRDLLGRIDHDNRTLRQPEAGEPPDRSGAARDRDDLRAGCCVRRAVARAQIPSNAQFTGLPPEGGSHKTAHKFQESFKYEGVQLRSRTVREVPAIEPNELNDLNLADWLEGRDSNADNLLQRRR